MTQRADIEAKYEFIYHSLENHAAELIKSSNMAPEETFRAIRPVLAGIWDTAVWATQQQHATPEAQRAHLLALFSQQVTWSEHAIQKSGSWLTV